MGAIGSHFWLRIIRIMLILDNLTKELTFKSVLIYTIAFLYKAYKRILALNGLTFRVNFF